MAANREVGLGTELVTTTEDHDFDKIHSIIQALDFLRIEAKRTDAQKLESLITGCFNMCFICHELALSLKNSRS